MLKKAGYFKFYIYLGQYSTVVIIRICVQYCEICYLPLEGAHVPQIRTVLLKHEIQYSISFPLSSRLLSHAVFMNSFCQSSTDYFTDHAEFSHSFFSLSSVWFPAVLVALIASVVVTFWFFVFLLGFRDAANVFSSSIMTPIQSRREVDGLCRSL